MADRIIETYDPELFALLCEEEERQRDTLDMIASESLMDQVSKALSGSAFGSKTAVGLPGHQRMEGSGPADKLERLAAERACALFGAEHANMLSYSGTTANLCAYDAVLQPGDTVLALDPEHGSHASHGRAAHLSGKIYRFVHFGLDPHTQLIDYDGLRELAERVKPRLMVIGASAYPRHFDYEKLADIAHKAGAVFMVDMAHTTGLAAGKAGPNPVPFADIVTASCTKTMCSCHTGFILCKKEFAGAVDRGVYPGLIASMHLQTVATAAWALKRAASPEFAALMQKTVENAKALCAALEKRGIPVLTGGTDCHLFVADLRGKAANGRQLTENLARMGIWTNSKKIPHDPSEEPGGVRAGCTVLTQRGMGAKEMERVADLWAAALDLDEEKLAWAKGEVAALCREFPEPV